MPGGASGTWRAAGAGRGSGSGSAACSGARATASSAGSFRRTGVGFIALRPEQQQAIAAFCRHAAPPHRARGR